MLQYSDEQEASWIPEDILEHRKELRDRHANVNEAVGVDRFFLSYGLPPLPLFPSDVEPILEVFGWGDGRGTWGRQVFTDGSGLASGVRGLTRCVLGCS